MRGASLSFLVRKGKQAEAFARPGPEGGRIVYASRIPPRPSEAGERLLVEELVG